MKTFVSVFFAILAAALVIYRFVSYQRASEERFKEHSDLRRSEQAWIDLAVACKSKKPEFVEQTERAMQDVIDHVKRELGDEEASAFETKLREAGCFQPRPRSTPPLQPK